MQIKNDTLVENRSFTKPAPEDFYIGLTLALLSSFFIGSSFILKKKGLLKLTSLNSNKEPIGLRAAHGGHGYLKEWLWWSGFLTMGVGEVCNFVAYMFAPATLVTPLGAISVLISAMMAAYFLDEKLNTIGKIGCFLTAIGSTVMVIHAPKEGQIRSVDELLSKILDLEFISYCVLSMISIFFLIFIFAPRYGNKNILIYILICSILGSYTVMSCKGIALGVKEILNENRYLSYFYTFVFILAAVSCIIVQINYLNKSLDIFNTAIVTTVYYVLFTLFVMIASSLLFKEMLNVSFQDFLGCMCGFSTIICALCLIHFFKTTANTSNLEFKSLNTLLNEKLNNSNNSIITSTDLVTMVVHQDAHLVSKENSVVKAPVSVALDKSDEYHQFNPHANSVNTVNLLNDKQQTTFIRSKEVINSNLNDLHTSKEISFLNYLNLSFNNFKSKYLKRTDYSNYQAYNYKKLISDDLVDEKLKPALAMSHQHQISINASNNTSNIKKKLSYNNKTYKPLSNREILSDDDEEDEIECSLITN